MPGYAHPKQYYQLVEDFREKINFIPNIFLEILQRYEKFLFWVLWATLATPTQNDSINLQETSMSICMRKINFNIHVFDSLIGQQHLGSKLENQNFARYGISSEISITVLVFIFNYFQVKPMINFSKNGKKTIQESFWALFVYMNFPEKGLCQFLNIPIIYHRTKNEKKLMTLS